jgi:glycosyltransferase involved in cell wall biosynthesis
MRIGIDACCWSNRRGFGRYTRELVRALAAEGPDHQFVLFADAWTAAEAGFPAGAEVEIVATGRRPTEAASADGARSPLDLWRMRRAVARRPLDLFYFPAVYSFFPLPRGLPALITFHDAIAESFPALIFANVRSRLFWNLKMRLALRQADRIVTVSAASRRQIARTFRRAEDAIPVIPEAPGPEFRPISDPVRAQAVRRRYRLPEGVPLILYVGGISPHKNLDGLLRAAGILRQRSTAPWHLAVVGDYEHDSFYGCYTAVSRLSRALKLGDRVTFTGFVPDDDLVALYNAAVCLALPSFDEGFGLPVIEAMACGLPVAISSSGSLPEVAREAGLQFPPSDPEAIAGALRRLLEDADLRSTLRAAGLRRAAEFSWTSAARQLLHVFEETGGGRARAA